MELRNIQGVATTGKLVADSNRLSKTLGKVITKLAEGKRIQRASDDAAGLAVAEQLSAMARGYKVATSNVSDAMSAVNIAEGASNEIQDMLQRQRELALQATNDTLTNEQRQNLNVEYQNLTQEIDRVANATTFNTQNLNNGTGLASGNAQIQAGPNQGNTITLPKTDMTAATLGVSGTSIATAAGASNAITAVDTALTSLNTQRSTLGAFTNRFESTTNNLAVAQVNTEAAESILRDQDMALGVAELIKNRLLQETNTKVLSRFNEISTDHTRAFFK